MQLVDAVPSCPAFRGLPAADDGGPHSALDHHGAPDQGHPDRLETADLATPGGPLDIILHRLHDVLPAAFGWTDTHLWAFESFNAVFAVGEIGAPHRNARSVALGQIAPTTGDTVRHVDDFGDDWNHRILVEAVDEAAPDGRYPRCLTGRRAGPPEDCGDVGGYQDLVDLLSDQGHPEHRDGSHGSAWMRPASSTRSGSTRTPSTAGSRRWPGRR